MNLRWLFRSVLVLGSVLAVPFGVLAQNVRFPETTVNVPITIGSTTYTLKISPGSLIDTLVVNPTSIQVTKGSATGSGLTITSTDRFELNNDKSIVTKCDGGLSKLEITTTNDAVTITPASNAAFCGEQQQLTGGGGGPPPPAPPSPPPAPKKNEPSPEVKKEVEKIKEIKKVKKDDQEAITEMLSLMVQQKTYKIPKSKKVQLNAKLNGEFALRIATALTDLCCSNDAKAPSFTKLQKIAKKARLFSGTFRAGTTMTRLKFYELLLESLGVELVETTAKDVNEVCTDAKNLTLQQARVFATARSLEIASTYKGGKCLLNGTLNNQDALKFGYRALQSKSQ